MRLIVGQADLVDACRRRRMKLAGRSVNLLESHVCAEGNLDGMEVRLSVNCIAGMPGDSEGCMVVQGNLAQLLSVLARFWPAPPDSGEVPVRSRKIQRDRQSGPRTPAE